MTQLIITLSSGSRIEPTKEQSKAIEQILFTIPSTTVVQEPRVKRAYTRRRTNARWTPDQIFAMRNYLNELPRGGNITTKDFRRIADRIGRKWKSVANYYYNHYKSVFEKGQYV